MNLGLYAIRTVSTPVVHAKDAPRAAPPKPTRSMAEDARLCNARLNCSTPPMSSRSVQGNAARMAFAQKRDAELSGVILDALRETPMSRNTISDTLGLTLDITRRVLSIMADKGLIVRTGIGKNGKWQVA